MRINRLIWIAALALIGLVLVCFCWQSAYDHDEVEHLHAAWMISKGFLPFTHFFEQHHPSLWYLLAPLAGLFKVPHTFIFIVRIFDLVGLAAFLFIVSKIMRRLFPDVDSKWPILLLFASFMFVRKEIEIRPDPWMNLFCFAGFLYWISYLQSEAKRTAFWAGCLFGLSIVMLQKSVPWILLVIIATLALPIFRRANKKRVVSGIGLLLLGLAIPIVVFLGSIRGLGILDDFLFWNYTFNRFFYFDAKIPFQFSSLSTFCWTFVYSPVLLLAGFPGVIIILWEFFKNRKNLDAKLENRFIVSFVALGFLPFLIKNKFLFHQYMIPWLPLLAIASSRVFILVRKTSAELILKIGTVLAAVALVVLLFVAQPNAQQNQIQEFILEHTSSDAAILVPPPEHPIFRRDGAYFWFNADMMGMTYASYCVANRCEKNVLDIERGLWSQNKPVYVYVHPNSPQFNPLNWKSHLTDYVPSKIPNLFVLKGLR